MMLLEHFFGLIVLLYKGYILIKRGCVFFENKRIRLRRKKGGMLSKRKIILREKIIFVGFFYLVILIVTNFL